MQALVEMAKEYCRARENRNEASRKNDLTMVDSWNSELTDRYGEILQYQKENDIPDHTIQKLLGA